MAGNQLFYFALFFLVPWEHITSARYSYRGEISVRQIIEVCLLLTQLNVFEQSAIRLYPTRVQILISNCFWIWLNFKTISLSSWVNLIEGPPPRVPGPGRQAGRHANPFSYSTKPVRLRLIRQLYPFIKSHLGGFWQKAKWPSKSRRKKSLKMSFSQERCVKQNNK